MALRVLQRLKVRSAAQPIASPFTKHWAKYFANEDRSSALAVDRSVDFLDWRILSNPRIQEITVLSDGRDSPSWAAIVRRVEDRGFCRGHVLLLRSFRTRPAVCEALTGVVRWALSADVDQLSLVTSDDLVLAEAHRWFPFRKDALFAFHSNSEEAWAFLDAPEQAWAAIDSDFDLMYP